MSIAKESMGSVLTMLCTHYGAHDTLAYSIACHVVRSWRSPSSATWKHMHGSRSSLTHLNQLVRPIKMIIFSSTAVSSPSLSLPFPFCLLTVPFYLNLTGRMVVVRAPDFHFKTVPQAPRWTRACVAFDLSETRNSCGIMVTADISLFPSPRLGRGPPKCLIRPY